MPRKPRRICFVTGTRAEFGLMQRTLHALSADRRLKLQIIATGMHLDDARGRSIDQIRAAGFKVDAIVPWDKHSLAVATGLASAGIATALKQLGSDVVLVVGDRVEAFAAASAGHLSGLAVAHVHGGDRALGQVDDALRHAITKLSHVHLAATRQSAARLKKLGEDDWRIHTVGSPGIDNIVQDAAPFESLNLPWPANCYALMVLHPTDQDAIEEFRRAKMIGDALLKTGSLNVLAVYPNNDPGSTGILKFLRSVRSNRFESFGNLERAQFLSCLRSAAFLIGNSSAGIIEAASFGTRVIDIGQRQRGRLCSGNVQHVEFEPAALRAAISAVWNGKTARRSRCKNIYGGQATARQIAKLLAEVKIDTRLLRKLIAY